MGRFASIVKGNTARLKGVRFTALDGRECVCDMRLLSGEDDELILERASARAREKGGEPRKGDPVYDFACAVEALNLAAVDPEAPEHAPAPFFASADEVRTHLDRDRISFLAERQAVYQDQISPLRKSLSEDEYRLAVLKIASAEAGDDSPFEGWQRSLLIDFTRTLARQFAASVMSKSASTSSSSSEESTVEKTSSNTSLVADKVH